MPNRGGCRVLPLAVALVAVLAALTGCAGRSTPGEATPDSASPTTAGTVPVLPWTERDVTVDGRQVHLACKGSGAPTVVFVSNLAEDGQTTWGRSQVPDRVAQRTTACIYDRPGLGRSDPGPSPRSIAAHVGDLDGLAQAAGISTPFVLVAQGYGTLIARQFARDHMDSVAGMVLVDPPLWAFDFNVPDGLTDEQFKEYESTIDVNLHLGDFGAGALPPPPKPTYVIGVDWSKPFVPADLPGIDQPPRPPTTREPGDPPERRRDVQKQLALKSPFGRFVALEGAGSYAQYWDPVGVSSVIDKVLTDVARTTPTTR